MSTYHDQGEGDHDPSQQLVGYGVLSERIPDGLIVAEEAPLEGSVLRGQDEKRKPDCLEGEENVGKSFNTGGCVMTIKIHLHDPTCTGATSNDKTRTEMHRSVMRQTGQS